MSAPDNTAVDFDPIQALIHQYGLKRARRIAEQVTLAFDGLRLLCGGHR